nr:hypothetical protein [Tanacetum cinerariifolium]
MSNQDVIIRLISANIRTQQP